MICCVCFGAEIVGLEGSGVVAEEEPCDDDVLEENSLISKPRSDGALEEEVDGLDIV